MKLTKPNRKTRNKLYKKAKEYYWSNCFYGICGLLSYTYRITYNIDITIQDVCDLFPEFMKRKPKDKTINQQWFNGGKDIRLAILDELIEETND